MLTINKKYTSENFSWPDKKYTIFLFANGGYRFKLLQIIYHIGGDSRPF